MANFYDKASLVLIPSGTKEGTIFSQKPTNGDGDFTFSRSTSATRVGPSGYIEKETQNLALQSNSFSTSPWSLQSSASLTSGQTGYDGSSDAWLLSKGADWSRLEQTISQSGVWTFSCYAKAGTLDWLSFENSGIDGDTTYFDLANGTLGILGIGCIDSSIEDIGSGWYRCSVTISGTSAFMRIQPSVSNGAVNGSNGNIYIQDAQLEQGLVARDYIETTTSAVYGGITDNVPRLDYTDSSCPALLLEPQRTNVIPQSEYFGASDWIKSRSVVSANTTISPSGIQDAATITENTFTNNFSGLERNIAVVNGTTYTQSIFVKKGNIDFFAVGYFIVGGANGRVIYNLNTKLVTLSSNITSSSITDFANGWVRISITYTANASSLNYFGYFHTKHSGTTYYDGDGTGFTHVWGAQLEQGSYATSYIPTYGSAVTRNNDVCGNAGNSDLFNDSEGVLYAEVSFSDRLTAKAISISGGSYTNRALFYLSTSGNLSAYTFVGGVNQCNITVGGYNYSDISKLALKYKENDFALWINGVEVGTDTSGTTFSAGALTELSFDANGANADIFYGNAKQIMVFNTALTDEELAALTTI